MPENHEKSTFKVKKLGRPAPGKQRVGHSGGALPLGLAHPSLIGKVWSSLPGLRETALNFTLDMDMMKQRKRLQFSDKSTRQSHLREWGSGSRLCEPLLLVPTEGEVSEQLRSIQRGPCG